MDDEQGTLSRYGVQEYQCIKVSNWQNLVKCCFAHHTSTHGRLRIPILMREKEESLQMSRKSKSLSSLERNTRADQVSDEQSREVILHYIPSES